MCLETLSTYTPIIIHSPLSANPHILAGDKAFALHIAGAKELLGLVQQGDGTPVGGPPVGARPKAVHPALLLLHLCVSLSEEAPEQQQRRCAPGMNLVNRRERSQTSGPPHWHRVQSSGGSRGRHDDGNGMKHQMTRPLITL